MSQNLDLVHLNFTAWERGDFWQVAGLHPEIAWAYVGGPELGSGTGLLALAAVMREWLGAWGHYHLEATDYRELDDRRILVFSRRFGRARISGLELGDLAREGANLFEVHDQKVTKLITYWDRYLALADLGLKE